MQFSIASSRGECLTYSVLCAIFDVVFTVHDSLGPKEFAVMLFAVEHSLVTHISVQPETFVKVGQE